jgi:hypothetical protein
MQPKTPTAPPVPVLSPSQITIAGSPLPGAAAIYQGFRAQARELADQMNDLENTRSSLTRQLERMPAGSSARTGIEQRITAIDSHIAAVDKQIADADAQLAKAAAIPGAAVEVPRFIRQGPSGAEFVMSALFITGALLLPLSIAYARRIWKRGGAVIAAFPKEIGERLGRVEQSVEATAIEVERIGEGQRFLTRLFTEGNGVRVLAAAPAEVVERKPPDAGQAIR